MRRLETLMDKYRTAIIDKDMEKIIVKGKLNIHIDDVLANIDPLKKLVLFGAGNNGATILQFLKDKNVKVDFFCDNNDNLRTFQGIEVVGVKDLTNDKKNIMIIITSVHYVEMIKQLEEIGLIDNVIGMMYTVHLYDRDLLYDNTEKILKLYEYLDDSKSKDVLMKILWHRLTCSYIYTNSIYEKNQYFDRDIIKLSGEEFFIDGGAFDGDTIKQFSLNTNNSFKRILSFEPDLHNYTKLKRYIDSLNDPRIEIFNNGIYDTDMKIGFNASSDICSQVDMDSEDFIDAIKLDNFKNEDITFIKLDIEGAELKALEGARNLIKKCRPKLAICVYHNPDDLWEIPLLIKHILPDYKIFLRHYMHICSETVCYAVV